MQFSGTRAFGKGLLHSQIKKFWLILNLFLRTRKCIHHSSVISVGGLGNSWSPVSEFLGAMKFVTPYARNMTTCGTRWRSSRTESYWEQKYGNVKKLFTFVSIANCPILSYLFCLLPSVLCQPCFPQLVILFQLHPELLIFSILTANNQVQIFITSA